MKSNKKMFEVLLRLHESNIVKESPFNYYINRIDVRICEGKIITGSSCKNKYGNVYDNEDQAEIPFDLISPNWVYNFIATMKTKFFFIEEDGFIFEIN